MIGNYVMKEFMKEKYPAQDKLETTSSLFDRYY